MTGPGIAPTTVDDRAEVEATAEERPVSASPARPEPPAEPEPLTEPEPPRHPGAETDSGAATDTGAETDTGAATDTNAETELDPTSEPATEAATAELPALGQQGIGEQPSVADQPGIDEQATAQLPAVEVPSVEEPATGTSADPSSPDASEPETDANVDVDANTETSAASGEAEPTAVEGEPPAPPVPGPVAPGAPPATSPTGSRSGRRLALIVGAVVVGGYLLLAGAWAVDAATHRDRVMRGVQLGGIDVGGENRQELANTVSTLTDRLADEELRVTVGSETITTDPVSLGGVLDGEAIADDALEARRGGFLPLRPIGWAAGLFSSHDVPLHYTVDPAVARQGVSSVIEPALLTAVEPELVLDGDELVVTPGSEGVAVDAQMVVDRLPAAIDGDAPYRLELPEEVAAPQVDEAALTALAESLNESTSEPIAVQVLDKRVQVSPATQRAWIRVDGEGDELTWSIDEVAALSDLQPLFPALGSEDQQARFEVVDEVPIIIPASETVICCAVGSAAVLADTIDTPLPPAAGDGGEGETGGTEEEPELRVANLDPETTGFDEGVAELESLGIIEQVSTFTTKHPCCANRVTNIHRIADLTQGVIIRPGEEFSLNGFVGRRTRENGFVADGAIASGNFEQQVGGGISQFATTFFNASFFAGVEFVEYQSHSIYISRYPRGREATISWPKPDLKIRNNTPYGILVWNEYTSESITVSFYSTKHLEVEALPLRRSSDRQCRIDITPRQITDEDGNVTEDSVFAAYRPGEGLDCNGNSTTPEEEAPKPASQPNPQPAPQPAPQPDPVPEPDPAPGDGDTNGGGAGGDGEVLPPG